MTVNQGGSLLARLDRIPVWPYPRSLLWVVGFGFFFATFDAVTIGFALPVIVRQFGVTSAQAAWAITSSLLGYIIGAFLDGVVKLIGHVGGVSTPAPDEMCCARASSAV